MVTIRQWRAGVRNCEHITLHSEHKRSVVGQLRPTRRPEHLLACAASQPESVAAGPRGGSPGCRSLRQESWPSAGRHVPRFPADGNHPQTGITRGRAPALMPFSAGPGLPSRIEEEEVAPGGVGQAQPLRSLREAAFCGKDSAPGRGEGGLAGCLRPCWAAVKTGCSAF